MEPNIVILGGSGFIGSALLSRFQQKASGAITSFSSSLDLTDQGCVDKLIQVVNPDTILILAARASHAKDQYTAFVKNIAIAMNVARCLFRVGAQRVVYFSTTAVYGDTTSNLSITESTKVAPHSLYGAAKFAGECQLKQAAEATRIPLLILRPCMVYGPGDTSMAYGPARFIHSILTEKTVRLFGDGAEGREYLFIRDLVEMVDRLIECGASGTLNLGTGHPYTFQDLIACLRAISPVAFDVVHVDRDRPKTDIRLNPTRLFELLPDFRFTDFKQGLLETYNDFALRSRR